MNYAGRTAMRKGLPQRARTAHPDWKPAALPTPQECLENLRRQRRLVTTEWGTECATGHLKPHTPAVAVPTAETLPVEPAPQRDRGYHLQHIPYQGHTYYPMPRGRRVKGNRTTADTVVTTQTRVVNKSVRRGKLVKASKPHGWKVTQPTSKVQRVRAKAAQWLGRTRV